MKSDDWLWIIENQIMRLQDTAEYLFRFGNIVAIGNAEYEVYPALTLGGDVPANGGSGLES
jgi:hypothetical protein